MQRGTECEPHTMNDESPSAEPAGVTPLASNLQAGKFLTVAEVVQSSGSRRCRYIG